jgi:glycosyltransferase involved in cell wall biosynthesis
LKILFTIDSLQQGGAEQSLASLIRHFPTETEVTVLYFFPKQDLLPEFDSLNIRLISVGLTSRYAWRKGMRILSETIDTEKPDVVVSCLYWSNIVSRLVCKMKKIPLVGTLVSDSYSKQRTSNFSPTRNLAFRFFKQLDRWTAKVPVRWIANSESIKISNATILGIDPQKISVVYRGRDTDTFSSWQSPPMYPFRFAFVGRLMETKGLGELIEAFAELKTVHELVQLDIYGDGPFRKALEEMIHRLGMHNHIVLHGRVVDAWQQLYKSHCFVFPSWYEGFSGALVEAMMTGIPIIASDIPMNLEAVEDRKTAHVFKVRDVQDLLSKMQETINNFQKSKAMGEQARVDATNRFNQKNISKQYLQLIIEASENQSKLKS